MNRENNKTYVCIYININRKRKIYESTKMEEGLSRGDNRKDIGIYTNNIYPNLESSLSFHILNESRMASFRHMRSRKESKKARVKE